MERLRGRNRKIKSRGWVVRVIERKIEEKGREMRGKGREVRG